MESNWGADRPTEVLLLCYQGKPATLGLSKSARCSLVPQTPQTLRFRKQSSGCAASHQAVCLPCTILPGSVCPSLPGRWGSLTSLQNPPSDAKLKPGQCRDQCCPGSSEGQPQCSSRQPSLRRLHQAGVHLPEKDWEQSLSLGWHWPQSILHVALNSAGMENVFSWASMCREVGFWLEQHIRLLRSSGIFLDIHTGSSSLCVTHLPYF